MRMLTGRAVKNVISCFVLFLIAFFIFHWEDVLALKINQRPSMPLLFDEGGDNDIPYSQSGIQFSNDDVRRLWENLMSLSELSEKELTKNAIESILNIQMEQEAHDSYRYISSDFMEFRFRKYQSEGGKFKSDAPFVSVFEFFLAERDAKHWGNYHEYVDFYKQRCIHFPRVPEAFLKHGWMIETPSYNPLTSSNYYPAKIMKVTLAMMHTSNGFNLVRSNQGYVYKLRFILNDETACLMAMTLEIRSFSSYRLGAFL